MRSETVLLIDSDEDSRLVFASMLRHHSYRVREASDAEAGLRLAWSSVPDLVVAELNLPGIDGCSLVEALRLHPGTARVPCLLIGTDSSSAVRARARSAGCFAYLLKPLSPTELLRVVQQLQAARPGKSASGSTMLEPDASAWSGMPGSLPHGA